MDQVPDKIFQGEPFPIGSADGPKQRPGPTQSGRMSRPSFIACSASATASIGIFWVVLVWVYYLLKARQTVAIDPILKAGIVVSILTLALWMNVYICNSELLRPLGSMQA
jgi:hypothetical protein